MQVGEAGRVLGIGPGGMRKIIDQGKLPAARTPSGVRIVRFSDVEALRQRREKAKGAPPREG